MSITVTTRSLVYPDVSDIVAIKIDSKDYVGKNGIIEIDFTAFSASGPGADNTGSVDLRVPNYDPDYDTPPINELIPSAPTMMSGTSYFSFLKYYFAVNNGVLAPCTQLQGDGTIDLLYLKVTAPTQSSPYSTSWSASLTYTLTFTDLTPTSVPGSPSTLALHLNPEDQDKTGIIYDSSFLGGGYVLFQIISLQTVSKPGTGTANSPPLFTLGNANQIITQHYVTQYSGVKNYPYTNCFVFAVNQAKPDCNTNQLSVPGASYNYLGASLQRNPQAMGDYDVTATLSYAKTTSTS